VGTLACPLVVIPALYTAIHLIYSALYDTALFYPTPVFQVSLAGWARAVFESARLLANLVAYGVGEILCGSLVYVGTTGVSVATGPLRGASAYPVVSALLVSAFALLVLGLAALGSATSRLRRAALALAVLVLGAYGVIAWGSVMSNRLIVLSNFLPGGVAEAASTHATTGRHHYAATIFLAALLAIVAESLARRGPRSRRAVHAVVLIVLVGLALRQPSDHEIVRSTVQSGVVLSSYSGVLTHIEKLAEASEPGATVYIENKPLGKSILGLKGEFFPGWAGVMVIFRPDSTVQGRTVRFIEGDPQLLARLRAQTGTRISQLVVAPEEVPPR
jgi:hypothetical protein